MNNDFSKPQRQSAFGIIIMAAHMVLKIGKTMVIPIILALLKMDGAFIGFMLGGIAILILLCIVFAYLWYLKFTFFLDKEKQEFVVNKGIVNRDQVIIQLDKIQQVNINQSILQKIIGVYELKIDTAGAKGEEVSIKAIDEAAAYNLKDHLLNRTTIQSEREKDVDSEVATEYTPILTISAKTLFKVGLTSNYGQTLTLMAVFFGYILQEARHIMDLFGLDKGVVKSTVIGLTTLFSVSVAVVMLLALLLIINLTRTFYKYFELQISKHQQSLLLSCGLIGKKNTLISPSKVQITNYSQNFFQRKLNMVNLSLKQAHFGQSKKGHEMQGNTLEIVGCHPSERDELLKMILGKVATKGNLFVPNWRFLNLPTFFKLVLPAVVFTTIALQVTEVRPFIILIVPYLLIGFLMVYISYRKHRLSVNEDFIIKTSGIWDISEEILIPSKIQCITTSQYPWHKSLDIGHLCLHTAAGEIHFKYGNFSEIKLLVNYWLFRVESEDENWM